MILLLTGYIYDESVNCDIFYEELAYKICKEMKGLNFGNLKLHWKDNKVQGSKKKKKSYYKSSINVVFVIALAN